VKRNFTCSAVVLLVGGLVASCRGQTSTESPLMPIRNMHRQQRYNPQQESPFFEDQRTMRTPPEGTIAREHFYPDERVTKGTEADGQTYLATIPEEIQRSAGGAQPLVERGRERYNIFCAPCHGQSGHGDGMVWRRSQVTGFVYPKPPSFHEDRVRHVPDGQVFATITNGVRNMPSYASQIPVHDRWAIVAYMRALQISQENTPGVAP